jgi:phage minor structural protein
MQVKKDSNTIGIDCSCFNSTISWGTVATDPRNIKFAYLRCSMGTSNSDTKFAKNAAGARANNILVGAYHFLRPIRPAYASTRATDEANNFVTKMQVGLGGGEFGDIYPVVDVEFPSTPAIANDPVETRDLLNYVQTFRNRVEQVTGRTIMAYVGVDYMQSPWNNFNYPTSAGPISDMPLWAAYWLRLHVGSSAPPDAGGWTQWRVWQYSDTGVVTGITTATDLNFGPDNLRFLQDNTAESKGLAPVKQLYVLNSNKRLQVVLSNASAACPFYNPIHTEQINQENKLTFSVPANHADAAEVIEGNLVFFRDFDDPTQIQLFEILRIEESHLGNLYKDVVCQHKVFELVDDWIDSLTLTDVTCGSALNSILTGTRWIVGAVEPVGTHTFRFFRVTVMEALRRIVTTCDGEWKFRVEFVGSDITAQYIDIVNQRGEDRGRRFEYSRDIKSIRRMIDNSRLVTKAFGYGGSTLITFSTVLWTTAGGDPADKPVSQLYVEDKLATSQYGRYRGSTNILPVENSFTSTTSNKITLLEQTWDYIQDNNFPRTTYELEVADLEIIAGSAHQKVRLGDTVKVIDTLFQPVLRSSARIYEVDRYLSEPEKNHVVISSLPLILIADS